MKNSFGTFVLNSYTLKHIIAIIIIIVSIATAYAITSERLEVQGRCLNVLELNIEKNLKDIDVNENCIILLQADVKHIKETSDKTETTVQKIWIKLNTQK